MGLCLTPVGGKIYHHLAVWCSTALAMHPFARSLLCLLGFRWYSIIIINMNFLEGPVVWSGHRPTKLLIDHFRKLSGFASRVLFFQLTRLARTSPGSRGPQLVLLCQQHLYFHPRNCFPPEITPIGGCREEFREGVDKNNLINSVPYFD
jgi:hypothetical protein